MSAGREGPGGAKPREPAGRGRSPRGGSPRRIGAAVGDLVSESEPQTLLARVQTRWASACGAGIAERARPVAERDGTVTIACVSATWAQELYMMQLELLRRLNEQLESASIEGLRFVVDGEPR